MSIHMSKNQFKTCIAKMLYYLVARLDLLNSCFINTCLCVTLAMIWC